MIQALTEGYRIAIGDDPTISKDVIALRFIDTLESLLTKQPPDNRVDIVTLMRMLRRES